jgi:actin-like ATPase involved in cell morphogenesis
MTYWLGIDLGTTYTAAALCRPAMGELETQVVPLGSRSPAVPSVLFLAGDGSLLVGEAAERYALTDPDRVVREFKRRIGDEIPLLVGGVPWPAHELAAVLAHRVWQQVNEREAGLPEGVALTYPASWGPYKISLFEQAMRAARIGEMTRLGQMELLSEPQAAAIGYASQAQVEMGARLAVYDLGGGTFDAAVIRKDSPTAFTLLGKPEGIDGLGGVTFDEMLFEHVCAAAGVPLTRINPNDPRIVPEVARLRRACTEAKETLSVDSDTTIPVALGGVRQRVRVTRAEFEEMIRPELDRTIEALHQALESAAVDGTQLDAILLVGGSSRIPLVSQLISAEFGRAPAIDADPKTTVALGAARFLAAAARPSEDSVATYTRLPAVPPERPQMSTMLSGYEDAEDEPMWHRPRKEVLAAAALVLLLVIGAAAWGAPKLAGALQHSAASPETTQSVVSTPAPSQSAGVTSPKRHSKSKSSPTSGPAPSATISQAASLAAQEPAKSTPSAAPVHSSPVPRPTPTPTRTRTRTPTPTPTPTTPTPTPTTPTPTPPTPTP